MKGFDVLKVKSAVKSRNKMDLSRTHLTTTNFGEILPMFVEETVPGDEFNVSANYFSRMAPLVKPTYGKFQYKTVAGYVPYHMLAVDAEAWLAGKTTFEGQTPLQRFIYMIDLVSFVINTAISTTGTSSNADFVYTDASGNLQYRVLTRKGKYMVKILNALGYALPSGVDLQTSSGWYTNVAYTKLSGYPLLAYLKLYNDYMSQSQRFNTSLLSNYLYKIKYNTQVSGIYDNTNGRILSAGILALLNTVVLNYENDYFTSAWQSPNAPLSSTESVTTITTPWNASTNQSIQQNGNNTWLATQGLSGNVSQRALDFLKSFDDWVRRNNYSGSRTVQQIYSRFGIKTDDYRSHYAHVIATDAIPIQVGDVTSVASVDDGLGEYAGKGIMNGSKGFSIKCDDYGIILVLGYYTVTPMNAYGFDRRVLRSTPLDYYNPEFDGLGADAISVGEYFADPIGGTNIPDYDTSVFGFTERYNSYRYGRDVITGEFRNYHANADMNCWHTGRLLTDIRQNGTLIAQAVDVNSMPQYASEYNRIFQVTGNDSFGVDEFYLTAQFNVSAIRPMLNLNQVPRLGEGDTTVPRNGNVIS